jgi:hypothetical protein
MIYVSTETAGAGQGRAFAVNARGGEVRRAKARALFVSAYLKLAIYLRAFGNPDYGSGGGEGCCRRLAQERAVADGREERRRRLAQGTCGGYRRGEALAARAGRDARRDGPPAARAEGRGGAGGGRTAAVAGKSGGADGMEG